MGTNNKASTTLVRMKGKENPPPLARMAQWMAIEVSEHSKLIFFPTVWEICSTLNYALFLTN